MFRRRAKTTMASPIEGEVRIQKVEKIDLVYNLLTKPSKPVAATGKYPASGHDVTGWKKTGNPSKGIVSVEDINKRSERYITEMKKRFLG